ncbi:DUF1080 domain-containing protein [Coraliomargarita sinensis]|uniref:DUF1080 domain-containing protein n=1 Tax=Coraliomargarita sinensis TaxID=2174842 RepID=A0A317ZFG4_9BACT|nr:DUF1080 domain-containing protein [Coraliomargarita sinensis]PXA04304.1 DUF1080 domain-containing protein [Coraliomargarita sinensis]
MKKILILLTLLAGFSALDAARFYGEPPDEHHPWAVHDMNRPQPPLVVPGDEYGDPPSDAIVLFEGKQSQENWKHLRPDDKRKNDWIFTDDYMQAVRGSGYIATKEEFGDCQLHVEWAAPEEVQGSGQGRGNSGVFLLNGMVEVQVLDNYRNPTYPDGSAGSVYGVMPPAANALRAPGEWQSYDIIFRRPIVRDGEVLDSGRLTVLVNGVVVQDSTPLEGGGGHKTRQDLDRVFPEKGSLRLQDHGNPVRFRNIWYRPLRPRPLDGGTDGRLSVEATMNKRTEIAASIRKDAQSMEGVDKALRLLESIVYLENKEARADANQLIQAYLEEFAVASADDAESYRGKMLELDRAFHYLKKYQFIDGDNKLLKKVDKICKEQGWKKR